MCNKMFLEFFFFILGRGMSGLKVWTERGSELWGLTRWGCRRRVLGSM